MTEYGRWDNYHGAVRSSSEWAGTLWHVFDDGSTAARCGEPLLGNKRTMLQRAIPPVATICLLCRARQRRSEVR